MLCAAVFGTADNSWNRFRGPNGRGVSLTAHSLPTELGPETACRYFIPLPPGHSSPIVHGGRVFLTAFEGERLWTIALRLEDGAELWRAEAPRTRVSKVDQRNNAASPTPAADDEQIVVFFPDFGMLAYDHDGNELWQMPLGPFHNLYGMGASPVLVDGAAILALDQNLDSCLLSVDAQSGEERWRTPRPYARSGHCTPVVDRRPDGDTHVLLPGSFYFDAYDLESGERVWWVSGLSFEMKSVPVLHDGTVYVNGYGSPMNQPGNQIELPPFPEVIAARDANGSGKVDKGEMPPNRAAAWFEFVDLDGSGALGPGEWSYLQDALASLNGVLAIATGGRGDRTADAVHWAWRRNVPQLPSPLLLGDALLLVDDSGGLASVLEVADGSLRQRGRIDGAIDNYYASPVMGDDKVFLVSESGIVSVLPTDGSLTARAVNPLGARCYATPALVEDHLLVRTESGLYSFGGE